MTEPPTDHRQDRRRPEASPDDDSGAFDPSDPLLGAWIEKRFTVIQRIAQGGMGKVYKAVQSPMGRICALKVLSPESGEQADPAFHQRFFLEAATASRLVHPNTVTIFDYGNSGELYFIAMEFLDGVNLRKLLNREGHLHPMRVRHLAAQICRSLQEAHGIGVIHRDLKPENIIVLDDPTRRDHVKVVDFGLAKAFRKDIALDLTGAGLAIGSPSYMSPEQILGDPISPSTDVYALGTLMFETLTGDVPFGGRDRYDTLMAHVNEAPPRLADRLPGSSLHPAWQQLLDRCLAKNPAERYSSMDELIAALKQIPGPSSSRPSLAPPASANRPSQRASLLAVPSAAPAPARPRIVRRSEAKVVVVAFVSAVAVSSALAALWYAWHRAPAAATRVSAAPSSLPVPAPSSSPQRR